MSVKRLIMALLLGVGIGGCSDVSGPKPSKPDPRSEVFEPVYRVATELRAAQEVGMNRHRFRELLEKLATEISLAKDKAESLREQQVVQGYSEVLQIYKDAAAVWDVKISVPELKDLADKEAKMRLVGGTLDPINQNAGFQLAVTEGIPLNYYPKGNTGIDTLVSRYRLPVTTSEGWKTIPNDSIERIWSHARIKSEQVAKLQPGVLTPATPDPTEAPPPGIRDAQQGVPPAVNGPNAGLLAPREPDARKPEPPSAQALYDRAMAMKDVNPEKSLELLREAQKTTKDKRLFSLIFGEINELELRPDVLYARAVKCKESDPKQARDYVEGALNGRPDEPLKQKLLALRTELTGDGNPQAPAPVNEEEARLKTIFKDWANQRGDALKKAQKMPKARGDAYMRSVDQRLVRDLTKKYDITHEELDRIEAYGAERNWW